MSYLNFKLKNCLIKSTCCNKSVVIKIGSDEITDSNNKEEIKEILLRHSHSTVCQSSIIFNE